MSLFILLSQLHTSIWFVAFYPWIYQSFHSSEVENRFILCHICTL